MALPGCRYFIFGKDRKVGKCYHEFTHSDSCPEGFVSDDYDFYRIDPSVGSPMTIVGIMQWQQPGEFLGPGNNARDVIFDRGKKGYAPWRVA